MRPWRTACHQAASGSSREIRSLRIGAEIIVVVRSANQRWFAERKTTLFDAPGLGVQFFQDSVPKEELNITNEIDRDIAPPKPRRQVRREREFHDILLPNGAIPLDVLERVVNEWLASKKK